MKCPASRFVMLTLVLYVCCAGVSLAQNKRVQWKEYAYPQDGFAITLPDAPRIQPDANMPETMAYSVNINPDYAFTVRVRRDPRSCNVLLGQFRERVLTGKARGSNPSSLRDISLGGYSGLECEWNVSDEKVALERYYCGEGRIFILAVNRERSQALMPAAAKIMNSFRPLTTLKLDNER